MGVEVEGGTMGLGGLLGSVGFEVGGLAVVDAEGQVNGGGVMGFVRVLEPAAAGLSGVLGRLL